MFGFHPLIEEWFTGRFAGPTEPQQQGWPPIAAGQHTLIAAPTGSGKTLTAFLACFDRLVRRSLEGTLTDTVQVVYVSPLRALSNDMHRNLEVPLAEINQLVAERHAAAVQAAQEPDDSHWTLSAAGQAETVPLRPPQEMRAGLRTGDTSASQRAALIRKPPHILVTTPESLYLLLTARRGREMLRNVETVIVDEIHALIRDRRGCHLALSLERLEALCGRKLQRVGLSATQRPIERTAEFLIGKGQPSALENGAASLPARPDSVPAALPAPDGQCRIIDVGHVRELDLAIETPEGELGAVCMHEQWDSIYQRLVELIQSHRSTLVFVNTRRMAERVSHQLTELLGEEHVSSHHGSLSAALRHGTEQRLKTGQLKAVVATASLELGIDVGCIDLVVQLGSPRSIATFLQRIGRSGHALGLVPKGRLLALTRDELLECMALIRAIGRGNLDTVRPPVAPLDVLAQQIVAEVSAGERTTDELFALVRQATPYQHLERREFDRTIEFLSEGIGEGPGSGSPLVYHDHVQQRLRPRPAAGLKAISNGGAIPEVASYRVVTEPDNVVVGSLDEEFAIESSRGDVVLLGNTSWRVLYVRGGEVRVVDAGGAPPSVPFWFGEAPGRTRELSTELSDLRQELEHRSVDPEEAALWLERETCCTAEAARQTVEYVRMQKAALGLVPTQRRVVFERFFDETGGMQLVVHAPFGGELTRAWGFAMRKRFCRSFDFELQATADDDGFILSLGPQHSFPIESLFPMLTPANARGLLEQAMLQVPAFEVRWRWNVIRALLVERRRHGKKIPPPLQRFRADDLLTAVFPRLTGCQEEHTGDIELPDHPLVAQTMEDCLREFMDLDGLVEVLEQIQSGSIELIARDTREPSPFCGELINSNPYTFLDGGEVQERRVRAVSSRSSVTGDSTDDLAALDGEAIRQVVAEASPLVRNADELHDLFVSRILLPETELHSSGRQAAVGKLSDWLEELTRDQRATRFALPDGQFAWAAAERLPAARALFPEAACEPPISAPSTVRQDWTALEARVELIRGLLEISGPVTVDEAVERTCLKHSQTAAALEALEGEGVVLRGHFRPASRTGQEPATAADSPVHLETATEEAESTTEAGSNTEPETTAILQPEDRPKPAEEWCHRRLLVRIHRLTLSQLRRQIQPVGVDVFLRYLTRHQGVLASHRRTGVGGVYDVISTLQGIDLPAVVWERDVLAVRVNSYEPGWLDELCLTGEVCWGRLCPPKRTASGNGATPAADSEETANGEAADSGMAEPADSAALPPARLTRVMPVSLLLREDLPWLLSAAPGPEGELSETASQLLDQLQASGAQFFTDLARQQGLQPAELNDVLGELTSCGMITADGFSGLRHLLSEKARGNSSGSRKPGFSRVRASGGGAGRWSLWRKPDQSAPLSASRNGSEPPPAAVASTDASGTRQAAASIDQAREDEAALEQWCWQLLRRWGVVFRDLAIREPAAPPWHELLRRFRRLEARGEIRGGRFIAGVAGEQFACGDAVSQLRELRDNGPQGELVVLSAADPANLVGLITEHARVPATASNRVALLDGVPAAAMQGGQLRMLNDLPESVSAEVLARLEQGQPGSWTCDRPANPGGPSEKPGARPAAPSSTHSTRMRALAASVDG